MGIIITALESVNHRIHQLQMNLEKQPNKNNESLELLDFIIDDLDHLSAKLGKNYNGAIASIIMEELLQEVEVDATTAGCVWGGKW